jgi:hypothetical protein
MNLGNGKTSLDPDAVWPGTAVAGAGRKPFRNVADGTTTATGLVKTQDGMLSGYDHALKRHCDLAMAARR